MCKWSVHAAAVSSARGVTEVTSETNALNENLIPTSGFHISALSIIWSHEKVLSLGKIKKKAKGGHTHSNKSVCASLNIKQFRLTHRFSSDFSLNSSATAEP